MVKVWFDEEHGIGKLHPYMRYFVLATLYVILHKVLLEILSRECFDGVLAEHDIGLSLHPVGGMSHFL